VTVFLLVEKDLKKSGLSIYNCDRAYNDSLDLAGYGRLFQKLDGRWIKGYSQKIGTCNALSAEM
jgi:hypothetical protein